MNEVGQVDRFKKLKAFWLLVGLTSFGDACRFVCGWICRAKDVPVRLKNPSCTIFLRPRNSDFEVLLQTFIAKGCDVREELGRAKRVIDGGANVGFTAIQFADSYPNAEIIAVEPESENYAMLVRNTRAFPNIKPVRAAIWPRPARVQLSSESDARSWAFKTREATAEESSSCEAIPIDALVNAEIPADLLKLDIEGAEWPLLEETGLDWLLHSRVVILELHGRDKVARLHRALQGRPVLIACQHEKHVIWPDVFTDGQKHDLNQTGI
jgi:FkbM family methyltransferase